MVIRMHKINIGDSAELTRAFSLEDLVVFSQLTNDLNPIHIDPDFVQEETPFPNPVIPGILLTSQFATLAANKLPGPKCIFVRQAFGFLQPAFIDQALTFKISVKHIDADTRIILLNCLCVDDERTKVVRGEMEVYFPKHFDKQQTRKRTAPI